VYLRGDVQGCSQQNGVVSRVWPSVEFDVAALGGVSERFNVGVLKTPVLLISLRVAVGRVAKL